MKKGDTVKLKEPSSHYMAIYRGKEFVVTGTTKRHFHFLFPIGEERYPTTERKDDFVKV